MKTNHINKKRQGQQIKRLGYTLVETLMTTLLFSVIIAAIYMTFLLGNRTIRHFSDEVRVRQQARLAMMTMIQELREAQNVFLVKENNELRLRFVRQNVGAVVYRWQAEPNGVGNIVRENNGRTRILAMNISDLVFSQARLGFLEITLSSQIKDKRGNIKEVGLMGAVALRPYMTFLNRTEREYVQTQ